MFLTACGNSSSSSSSDSSSDEAKEEVKEPQATIKNGIDVEEIELVSWDENGITLSFTQNHGNIIIFPKGFEVAGEYYSLLGSDEELNPEVHFRVDDSEEDTYNLDIKEGETHTATISIDGVSDYTHLKTTVDNTPYYDEGKSYPIRNVSFEVVIE